MKEKLSTQYNDAVQQIKAAILRSQAKALAGVNHEQLALYYGIGRYISFNTRRGFWGKDAIATISRQLSAELPGLRGFSQTNLRLMRIFYEEWRTLEANSSVATDELRRFPDSRLHEYWLFTPFGYLGQLSHYLHVLDDEDRLEGENPPVGIILCKDADKTFVEYVLQD